MASDDGILMIVYSLDENHPIFGHQARIAAEVAKVRPTSHFLSIYPVDEQKIGVLPNLIASQFTVVGWREGSLIRNLFKFWLIFLMTLVKVRPKVVFSHMVDSQAAMIAPLLFVLRKTHILWYAHKKRSIQLVICSIFCKYILTSTRESCPINSSKIRVVGQSIDSRQFSPRTEVTTLNRAIYVGRLDRSKRIQHMVREANLALERGFISSVALFGNFSSGEELASQSSSFDQLSFEFSWFKNSIKGSVDRTNLPIIMKSYDVFIHGYLGSLDKVLVEATLLLLPVATENPEYLKEFGFWPGCLPGATISEQLEAISKLSMSELQSVLTDRYNFAINNHSLDHWMEKFLYFVDERGKKF